jgi:hypothetical protein
MCSAYPKLSADLSLKAEWTKGEANPRFIVTSVKEEVVAAQALYEDVSCARGEMENRMYGRLPLCKRCLRRSGMRGQLLQ